MSSIRLDVAHLKGGKNSKVFLWLIYFEVLLYPQQS